MTDFGALLDAMTVTAQSPDGNITAVLSHRDQVEFAFIEEMFDGYDAAGLSGQLSALLRLLEVGRLRGWRMVRAESGIKPVDRSVAHWDPRRRRYQAAVAEIEAVGMSDSEAVTVSALGFRGFDVTIDPAGFHDLAEPEFVCELSDAVADFVADYREQIRELKAEHFTGNSRPVGMGEMR